MEQERIPRFRAKVYAGKNGQSYTYYVWDGRGRGLKEVRLGSDRSRALELWADCEKGILPSKAATVRRLPLLSKGKRRSVNCSEWLAADPWIRTMFYNAERRAMKARKPFTLSPQDMLSLVHESGGVCALSGIPFDKTRESAPFAPSLDRINCAAGYEKGNVRLVCHIANVSMNTWGIEPVLRLAEAVSRQRQLSVEPKIGAT